MTNSLRNNLLVLLLLTLFLPCQLFIASSVEAADAKTTHQEVLILQQYLFWQRINEARSNPLEVLGRLGITLEHAQAVLADDAFILDHGLPPLAWNDKLGLAATLHSQDMFNNLYYSHASLSGAEPMERIAATGYQALAEGETLGALVFNNFVDLELAVNFLVDNMLYDELTGAANVSRNIFSYEMTELGVSFDVQAIPILDERPYVYLLVIDFARSLEPRSFIVAQTSPEDYATWYDYVSWDWLPMTQYGNLSQTPYPVGGTYVVARDEQGGRQGDPVFAPAIVINNNYFINLQR